ncbi:MAG: recombinase family protein [Ruminiclostridium sp.]|nr:recombinase family protein [Ruminiclostridium sp.]
MGREPLWRVGLYIRLSREDGRQESLSVENQRKILLDFLKSDFTGRWELAGEYIDDGLTGTDDSREGFQTLIAQVRAGKVNCILCKTLSRAFRNYADQGYFLEEFFPRHRTRFIALGSPQVDSFLDPEAVQTGLEIPINGILNDRYAARTSADVRRTLDMKRRRGEFIGSFAPYGYEKDPGDKNRLVLDPVAAEVVGKIFHWYTQGMGMGTIAARLNGEGIPNPAAYKASRGIGYGRKDNDGLWSPATVGRILANPVYGGTMVQGRQRVVSYKVHQTMSVPPEDWYVVEGTHQPIVSQSLLERAGALREIHTRRSPGKRELHLLAGLLRCADCGKSMTRKTARGIVYYTCSTYRRKSRTACTSHTIREDKVLEQLSNLLQVPVEGLTRPLLIQKIGGVRVHAGGGLDIDGI